MGDNIKKSKYVQFRDLIPKKQYLKMSEEEQISFCLKHKIVEVVKNSVNDSEFVDYTREFLEEVLEEGLAFSQEDYDLKTEVNIELRLAFDNNERNEILNSFYDKIKKKLKENPWSKCYFLSNRERRSLYGYETFSEVIAEEIKSKHREILIGYFTIEAAKNPLWVNNQKIIQELGELIMGENSLKVIKNYSRNIQENDSVDNDKIEFKVSPALLGHIFLELIEKDYMQPVLSAGDPNYSGTAKKLWDHFDIINTDGKKTTLENWIKVMNPNKNPLAEAKRQKIIIPHKKDL